jgi:hypothetical protein
MLHPFNALGFKVSHHLQQPNAYIMIAVKCVQVYGAPVWPQQVREQTESESLLPDLLFHNDHDRIELENGWIVA